VVILGLEETHERLLEHSSLPFPVLIKGNLDRVEIRNGKIRIIDYKTGKVEGRHVALSHWDGLTTDVKYEKIIQVLAYAYIYEAKSGGREIEAGIISFKNMKSGFLPFKFKEGKSDITVVTKEISTHYIEQLVLLLGEILDPDVSFKEAIL
ncbi:MAG: PD-(D/E)XK nuclease family protein, partial [Flavobacterium sp.]